MNFIHTFSQTLESIDGKLLLQRFDLTVPSFAINACKKRTPNKDGDAEMSGDDEEGNQKHNEIPLFDETRLRHGLMSEIYNAVLLSEQDKRLDNPSKFGTLLGGYNSLFEANYVLLCHVEQGNKDDEQLFNVKLVTNLKIKEKYIIEHLQSAIKKSVAALLEIYQEKKADDELKECLDGIKSLGHKSVKLQSDMGKLNESLQTDILHDITQSQLNNMVKSFHMWRLCHSSYWTSLEQDQYLVDSSYVNADAIHADTCTQKGRLTKNLDYLLLHTSNGNIFLDGVDGKSTCITLTYDLELTIKMGRALRMDSGLDEKKLLKNMEEQKFLMGTNFEPLMLSGMHKQGLELNKGFVIMRHMINQSYAWIKPSQLYRQKVVIVPLASIFHAILSYREIMEHYFYLPSSKDDMDNRKVKMQIKLLNFEYVHFKGNYAPPEPTAPMFQTNFHKDFLRRRGKFVDVKKIGGIMQDMDQAQLTLMKEERLANLNKILDYIKSKQQQRIYFNKNGNSDQYKKFNEDKEISEFHTQLYYFNGFHIPQKAFDSKKPKTAPDDLTNCVKYKAYILALRQVSLPFNAFEAAAKGPEHDVAQKHSTQMEKFQRVDNLRDETTARCSPNASPEKEDDKEDEEMKDEEQIPPGTPEPVHQDSPLDDEGGGQGLVFRKAGEDRAAQLERARANLSNPAVRVTTGGVVDYLDVEGFKFAGSNKKLEIKNPVRTESHFLAFDIFDDHQGPEY